MGMEEVDEIIIHTLKGIECPIDDDYKTLKDFKPDDVGNAVLACMRRIDTERAYPKLIPRNMAQKVTVCQDVARRLTELGYKNEISYDDLVYPSEGSTRQVLRFLVDELPLDEGDETEDDNQDPSVSIRKSIKAEMQAAMKETWTHKPNARRQNYAEVKRLVTTPLRSAFIPGPRSSRNAPQEAYIRQHLPLATEQPKLKHDAVPSILEHNLAAWVDEKEREEEWNRVHAKGGVDNQAQWRQRKLAGINRMMNESLRETLQFAGLGHGAAKSTTESLAELLNSWNVSSRSLDSKFKRDVDLRDKRDVEPVTTETDEELQARRARELEELDQILTRTRNEADELEKAISTFGNSIRQIEAESLIEEQRKKELQQKYMVAKKTFDLLPDADNNIAKLREIAEKSSRRLVELASEWEKHRAPLIAQYRELRDKLLHKKDEGASKIDEMRKMKATMRELSEEIRKKQEVLKDKVEEYKAMPKDINRAVYTRRILDILKNVKKQKVEINKILIDMRTLMKEITLVTDTLTRSYAVTDNLLFADAKKDEVGKQSYKELVTMDTSFKKLGGMIEETGEARKTIMELEVKLEQMSERVNNLNADRVKQDLKAMKEENKQLLRRAQQAAPLDDGNNDD